MLRPRSTRLPALAAALALGASLSTFLLYEGAGPKRSVPPLATAIAAIR